MKERYEHVAEHTPSLLIFKNIPFRKQLFIVKMSESSDGISTQQTDTSIPWNLIPETGQYIVEIMKYCGYADVDAIAQLHDSEE